VRRPPYSADLEIVLGNSRGDRTDAIQACVAALDSRETDFEYEGEMNAGVALNPDHPRIYPLARLSGLIMNAILAALAAHDLSAEEAAGAAAPD
jgi:malate dehydrogenase (oxaloacetate-decarboxylating)(NADP+)